MPDRHVMVTETTLPYGWTLQCPVCAHRAFFYRSGEYVVIDKGDFYARHSWSSTPELSLVAALEVSDG